MNVDMKSLARLGAQARLVELVAEMDVILNAFPDLAQPSAPPPQRQSKRAVESVAPQPKARRRHRMSAAERRAVSVRMKKYWAKRRKAGKGR